MFFKVHSRSTFLSAFCILSSFLLSLVVYVSWYSRVFIPSVPAFRLYHLLFILRSYARVLATGSSRLMPLIPVSPQFSFWTSEIVYLFILSYMLHTCTLGIHGEQTSSEMQQLSIKYSSLLPVPVRTDNKSYCLQLQHLEERLIVRH